VRVADLYSAHDNIRPLTIDGPMSRMVLTVLGMVAERELGFVRDRQRAGI
jgi:DNA invertase Pin-like site-specific DNA recombinase